MEMLKNRFFDQATFSRMTQITGPAKVRVGIIEITACKKCFLKCLIIPEVALQNPFTEILSASPMFFRRYIFLLCPGIPRTWTIKSVVVTRSVTLRFVRFGGLREQPPGTKLPFEYINHLEGPMPDSPD